MRMPSKNQLKQTIERIIVYALWYKLSTKCVRFESKYVQNLFDFRSEWCREWRDDGT